MAKSKLKLAAELMGAQGGNTKSEKRVAQAKINLEKARSKRWIKLSHETLANTGANGG